MDAADRVLVLVRDVERDGRTVHEVRLPKGHIDPGETVEQTALRETCEESGYCDLDIVADLGTARSEYDFRGKHFVRTENYFLMRLRSSEQRPQDVKPGSEEALFNPTWLPDLATALRELTYESEREFVRRAAVWLAHSG